MSQHVALYVHARLGEERYTRGFNSYGGAWDQITWTSQFIKPVHSANNQACAGRILLDAFITLCHIFIHVALMAKLTWRTETKGADHLSQITKGVISRSINNKGGPFVWHLYIRVGFMVHAALIEVGVNYWGVMGSSKGCHYTNKKLIKVSQLQKWRRAEHCAYK